MPDKIVAAIVAKKFALPFMVLAAGGTTPKFNLSRIAEALIISAVTGLVVLYGQQQVLTEKANSVEDRMASIEARQEMLRDEIHSLSAMLRMQLVGPQVPRK